MCRCDTMRAECLRLICDELATACCLEILRQYAEYEEKTENTRIWLLLVRHYTGKWGENPFSSGFSEKHRKNQLKTGESAALAGHLCNVIVRKLLQRRGNPAYFSG